MSCCLVQCFVSTRGVFRQDDILFLENVPTFNGAATPVWVGVVLRASR